MTKPNTKVSIITASMSRLMHLKNSLPSRIHPDIENIVVDWSCPHNSGDWVESRYDNDQVNVIRVMGEQYFSPSKSRNIGFKNATSEWIIQCDADCTIDTRWLLYNIDKLDPKCYYVRLPTITTLDRKKHPIIPIGKTRCRAWVDKSTGFCDYDMVSSFGFIIFPRSAFDTIGYFDEIYGYNYACEDMDYRLSLNIKMGLREVVIPKGVAKVRTHENNLRVENVVNSTSVTDNYEIQGKILKEKYGINWRSRLSKILNHNIGAV